MCVGLSSLGDAKTSLFCIDVSAVDDDAKNDTDESIMVSYDILPLHTGSSLLPKTLAAPIARERC